MKRFRTGRYGDEQAIINADRTIVYLLHKDIGHLGIFVSGRVAAKEHTELVGTLEMIDALPAGLYEMVIEAKPEDARAAELEPGQYLVRFESRTINDIRALDDTREDETAFNAVDAVSRSNDRWYRTMVGPWVKAMTTEESAAALRRLHPLRLQRELLSDLNPAMHPVGMAAAAVRGHRVKVSPDNPLPAMERAWSEAVVAALNCVRDIRDAWTETCFKLIYGPMGVGALMPPSAAPAESSEAPQTAATPADADYTSGGALAGVLRMVALGVLDRGDFDRRSALIFRELRAHSRFSSARPEQVRELFRQQARLIRHNRERAIATLADLLASHEDRVAAAEAVRRVLMVRRDELRLDRPLVARVAEVLKLKPEDLGLEAQEVAERAVPHFPAARPPRPRGTTSR